MPYLSILACYAHPDDEQGVTGTLRLALDAGIRVGLLCATRGEVGEIADPSLATPETLGEVREQELRRACEIIGIKDLYFLDYRDSGMVGTPENKDPRVYQRQRRRSGRAYRQDRAGLQADNYGYV
jgi:LmbE family N-acetylglucosaminyl deacetylase